MHVMSFNPFIGRIRRLSDLSQLSDAGLRRRIADLRASHAVAVLDDDPSCPAHRQLSSLRYNVHFFRSLNDLGSKDVFSIYVCDVLGITNLGRMDGGYAISEIRRTNPLCYIICNSAAAANDRKLVEAKRYCDVFLPKHSTDTAALSQALDNAILEMASPTAYWRRVQRYLLEADVSTIELAVLEHYWVCAAISGDKAGFEECVAKVSRTSKLNLGPIIMESAKLALEVGAKLAIDH